MPELPEVETVKNTLKKQILNKTIIQANIYWDNIIEFPTKEKFKNQIKNQKINDILRRGKWLMFKLDDYYLLSHLRMEGKYFIKPKIDKKDKHEHIIFTLDDQNQLRYHDTRKFGKMYLIEKTQITKAKPLKDLGKEPWDKTLTPKYLKTKLNKKPIKTSLLDQTIIAGIGNIYADEILFQSKIHPETISNTLKEKDLENIIKYTKETLKKAINQGGTTIKSYTSSQGVHGKFQNSLLVHTKQTCPICQTKIETIKINQRTTYYCPKCQKKPI